MHMNTTVSEHIEITPGTCGGKPRIAGTRISVQHIVLLTEQNLSADEIIARHPHVKLADVHAALAYYYDNQEEIDRQIRESDEFVALVKAKHSRSNDDKPVSTDADADSLSS